MNQAEKFFYQHAGYGYDPKRETAEQGKRRGARALAQAEQYAVTQDWGYSWEPDDNGCSGCECQSADCDCFTGARHDTLGCVLRTVDGTVLESLWGICGATPEYSRVVEAELALEAMQEHKRKQTELRKSVRHVNA